MHFPALNARLHLQVGGKVSVSVSEEVVSPAEAIKPLVLERIRALGGEVSGADYEEIRDELKLDECVSLNTLRSALWKLTCMEGHLRYFSVRDWVGCDPRCIPAIAQRIYRLV